MSSYLESNREESNLISNNTVPLPLVPNIPNSEPTKDLAQPTMKDKETIIVDPAQYYVKASFMLVYILSLTTATVTFTESLRNNSCTKSPCVEFTYLYIDCIRIFLFFIFKSN